MSGLVIRAPPDAVDGLCPRRATQIKTYSWDNAQVLLVGNKCDMEDERVVAAERGRQLSEQLGTSTHSLGRTQGGWPGRWGDGPAGLSRLRRRPVMSR